MSTIPPKIVQKDDAVLRKEAKLVELSEIPSGEIQKVIENMKVALAGERDGAAIAAPQIGIPLRIFVVSHKILSKNPEESASYSDMVCINPEILRVAKKKTLMDEGCLSVRGKYGMVPRATRITIRAYDEKGVKFTRGAGGLLAQVFQHEIDHLNGILFIDKARDTWDVDEKKEQPAL